MAATLLDGSVLLDSVKDDLRERIKHLAEKGITNRDALADLAGDELVELTGLSNERAQELIMKARAHWFEGTESAASAEQGHQA